MENIADQIADSLQRYMTDRPLLAPLPRREDMIWYRQRAKVLQYVDLHFQLAVRGLETVSSIRTVVQRTFSDGGVEREEEVEDDDDAESEEEEEEEGGTSAPTVRARDKGKGREF